MRNGILVGIAVVILISAGLAITMLSSPPEPQTTGETKIAYSQVSEDQEIGTVIDSIDMMAGNLVVKFHHNSQAPQPVSVIGNVSYELDREVVGPGEEGTLIVYNWDQEYFRLKVGVASDEFIFGAPVVISKKDESIRVVPGSVFCVEREVENKDLDPKSPVFVPLWTGGLELVSIDLKHTVTETQYVDSCGTCLVEYPNCTPDNKTCYPYSVLETSCQDCGTKKVKTTQEKTIYAPITAGDYKAGTGAPGEEKAIEGFKGEVAEFADLDSIGYSSGFQLADGGKQTVRTCFRAPPFGSGKTTGRISYIVHDANLYDYETTTWWNSSYIYKRAIYGATDAGTVTMPVNVNDTGIAFADHQYVWCNLAVTPAWGVIGYLYYNDETDYVCVDSAESHQVGQDVERGNSSSYTDIWTSASIIYHLNSSAGLGANDSSGNGYEGFLQNGALFVDDGKIDGGVNLTDKDDLVLLPAAVSGTMTSGTMSIWIRPQNTMSSGGGIGTNGDRLYRPESGSHDDIFFVEGDGRLAADSWCTGPATLYTTTATWDAGTWYHIAYTWNSTQASVWVNGVMEGNCTKNGPLAVDIANMKIGYRGATWGGFIGTIDEFRTWNITTLSGEQLMAEYNNSYGSHNFTELGPQENIPMAPTVSLYNVTGITTDPTPGIDFNFTDNDLTNICYLLLNGTAYAVNNTAVNATRTTLITNASLAADDYEVNVSCSDGTDSNVSGSIILTIDLAGPTITLNSPANGSYILPGITIDMGITDVSGVSYALYSRNDWATNTTLPVPYDIDTSGWPDGEEKVLVWANDTGGVGASVQVNVTIDGTEPDVTVSSPANGSVTDQAVTITGTCTDSNPDSAYTNSTYFDSIDTSPASFSFANTTELTNGVHDVTVYCNDSANNTGAGEVYFTFDNIYPVPVVTSPANTSYASTGLDINYTVIEANPDSVWYEYNGVNTTLSGNATFTALDNQQSTIIIWANDTVGHYNYSAVVFTVDSSVPLISFASPTPGNNTNQSSANLTINISVYDASNDTVVLALNGTNITMTGNCTGAAPYISCNMTVSDLAHGVYEYYAWANDTIGNMNQTGNYTVTIDLAEPALLINYPLNDTYLGTSLDFNFSYSDNGTAMDSCWYNLDNSTSNVTLPGCANTTLSLEYSQHVLTLFGNDTAGNTNHSNTVIFSNAYAIWNISLFNEDEWTTPFDVSLPDNVTLFTYCVSGDEYSYDLSNSSNYPNLTIFCEIESIIVKVEYPTDSYIRERLAASGLNISVPIYLVDAYNYTVLQIPIYMDDYTYYDSLITLYKKSEADTYIISQGYFDVEHKHITYLKKDSKYLIRITKGGEIREIGFFYAIAAGDQHISISTVTLRPDISLISDHLRMTAEMDNTTSSVIARYEDDLNETNSVRVRVYEGVNQTAYYDQTFSSGTDNLTVTILGVNTSLRYNVLFTVNHQELGNSPIDYPIGVGLFGAAVDLGISSWMYPALAFFVIFCTSMVTVPRNRLAGLVFLGVLIGVFFYIGWLAYAVGVVFLMMVFIAVSIIYELKRGGME